MEIKKTNLKINDPDFYLFFIFSRVSFYIHQSTGTMQNCDGLRCNIISLTDLGPNTGLTHNNIVNIRYNHTFGIEGFVARNVHMLVRCTSPHMRVGLGALKTRYEEWNIQFHKKLATSICLVAKPVTTCGVWNIGNSWATLLYVRIRILLLASILLLFKIDVSELANVLIRHRLKFGPLCLPIMC